MQFHRFRQLAVLAGALLLAGCVAEGGPDYRPPIRPGPSQPQMCPMIYAPVCATRGSSRKTFGNSCQARPSAIPVRQELRAIASSQMASAHQDRVRDGAAKAACVRRIRATDRAGRARVLARGNICLFAQDAVTTGALSPTVAKPTVQAIAL
ncbi:hypothetical protein [Brucella anthropi]|uniref:hypothetical protein n=1 Tax=Brucella anthropi TaxID=529 RepID=UPI002157F91E|nr:hypothetical protein [Brucella anthropi]MCR8490594.1 hypothetical protein [Brucella anthropi]